VATNRKKLNTFNFCRHAARLVGTSFVCLFVCYCPLCCTYLTAIWLPDRKDVNKLTDETGIIHLELSTCWHSTVRKHSHFQTSLKNPSIQTHLVLLCCTKRLCIFGPKGAIQIRYYYYLLYVKCLVVCIKERMPMDRKTPQPCHVSLYWYDISRIAKHIEAKFCMAVRLELHPFIFMYSAGEGSETAHNFNQTTQKKYPI